MLDKEGKVVKKSYIREQEFVATLLIRLNHPRTYIPLAIFVILFTVLKIVLPLMNDPVQKAFFIVELVGATSVFGLAIQLYQFLKRPIMKIRVAAPLQNRENFWRTLLPGFVEGHSHIITGRETQGLSLDEAQEGALSFGWTTINELRMAPDAIFEEIKQAEQSGTLRIRVNAFFQYNRSRLDPDGSNEVLGDFWQVQPPILASDGFFRIVGIKVYIDGSLANNPARGCWALTEPYTEEFQQIDYFRDFCKGEENGSLYLNQAELNEVVTEAQEAGLQVAIHANGDRAIDLALNAIENANDGASNEVYRHQIQHSSLLRPDQIIRYQELDIIAAIRGTFVTCRQENQPFIFGEERYKFVVNRYSLPTLIEHAFAEGHFGWDYDPYTVFTRDNPMNPLVNLWGFVTRKDIDEEGTICDPQAWAAEPEITVEQGLRLLTIGPAYAAGQEEVLGTLKAGKFADIIILDRNPIQVEPDEILNLSVLMTMVGGNVEFCKDGNEALCP